LREDAVEEYRRYVRSFLEIKDTRVRATVDEALEQGLLWPEPFVGLSPAFEPGAWIDDLVSEGVLHETCRQVFRKDKSESPPRSGNPMRLHRHQEDAIRHAATGRSYILTTGTGSGKSLAYIVPIVDHVLRNGPGRGIQAIVVYPMNALVNSQHGELTKYLKHGFPDGKGPVTFARYTGQESDDERNAIVADGPDIILTNYVMLELILTRVRDKPLLNQAGGLKFLVLDEMHTYRGRQGADVAYLARRVREALQAPNLQCIGTSATLASEGSYEERRRAVARVGSQMFGTTVEAQDVIGETLRRACQPIDTGDAADRGRLRDRVASANAPSESYEEFVSDPLSSWVEQTLGVHSVEGRLVRRTPRQLTGDEGAAAELAQLTAVPLNDCLHAVETQLLGGYRAHHPETDLPAFAFRLHQFLSRGETVFASLDSPDDRHISLEGQRFVPGDRSRLLFPLAFCRQCGQEYYSVRRSFGPKPGNTPRAFDDVLPETKAEKDGYLMVGPDAEGWMIQRLPEDWLETAADGSDRIRYALRQHAPQLCIVDTEGAEGGNGIHALFIPRPFRLCAHCGAAYSGSQRTDFAKLSTLGSGGRSTATTIVSLAVIRWLRSSERPDLAKLLAFSDNRQDASLQAGHFNDFVQTGLVRSALFRACAEAAPVGVAYDELAVRVFKALDLPFEAYSSNPHDQLGRKRTEEALRQVLTYRLYLDQRRGWRLTAPNLEQVGLLDFGYERLGELCAEDKYWADRHALLAAAPANVRERISTVLLDLMRRELCIDVEYLDRAYHEGLKQRSRQLLVAPWGIDPSERLMYASVLLPRSQTEGREDSGDFFFLSGRSGYGRFLRQPSTLTAWTGKKTVLETETIIKDLLATLTKAGIVQPVADVPGGNQLPGYLLKAAALSWRAGDGTSGYHDPVRMPLAPMGGVKPNLYFQDLYRRPAADSAGIRAAEHTAQVPHEVREQREQAFRSGSLPVLYCSPTMELGIDIADLSVVGMRNVPPTPANYAQRSGRAGRQGQPALIFTYCSTGSPHDRYFFRRAERMIAGAVAPPRLDLANEDLVRGHLDAIWLAESGLSLGRHLTDVLDLTGEEPSLESLPSVAADLANEKRRTSALVRIKSAFADVMPELHSAPWWGPTWLEDQLGSVPLRFDAACERWRDLYRAARNQIKVQNAITLQATRTKRERDIAEQLRAQAVSQLALLEGKGDDSGQSDFSSYRYFASEGFLPGYSFPRLPLTAWIPGLRAAGAKDEFLQRPRFLAISEFGPRNVIYHEGSRYVVTQVQLPLDPAETGARRLVTSTAKRCPNCGYLHPVTDGAGADLCEHCGTELVHTTGPLLRLQHVFTRRRDRINADEEERTRQGYEIATGFRFATREGAQSVRTAEVVGLHGPVARLTYGGAASLWRINLGWRRRDHDQGDGFLLNPERGTWARNQEEEDPDPEDGPDEGRQRVIPFVQDARNCLVVEPAEKLPSETLASLEAALRCAIAAEFQLEDSELVSEPLPDRTVRNAILFFEAAEGGAGVLRRLVEEPKTIARLARTALDLAHFDPETGADRRRAARAREDCEAACYDCLLSYQNQLDHGLLDRKLVLEALIAMRDASVKVAPGPEMRSEKMKRLLALCVAAGEKDWLTYIEARGHRLPDHAGKLIAEAGTRPDFLYDSPSKVAVYLDGSVHRHEDIAEEDRAKTAALENLGYRVIRFKNERNLWDAALDDFPGIFGKPG
jgi:ATP-dependent helicase YprA (DUF1998 family)